MTPQQCYMYCCDEKLLMVDGSTKSKVKPHEAVAMGLKGPDGKPLKRYAKSLFQIIKEQEDAKKAKRKRRRRRRKE